MCFPATAAVVMGNCQRNASDRSTIAVRQHLQVSQAVVVDLQHASTHSSQRLPFCTQVEGCQRLLRDEKAYYQRFLVCEDHMRCLSLDINGQMSRFCQQCGKFEPLEVFDDDKRYS
jgi:hypothetical protein